VKQRLRQALYGLAVILAIAAWLIGAYVYETWTPGEPATCDQPVHCEDPSGPGPGNGR
jgi:hypothetical protein